MRKTRDEQLAEALSQLTRPEGCEGGLAWEFGPLGDARAWFDCGASCAAHYPKAAKELARLRA